MNSTGFLVANVPERAQTFDSIADTYAQVRPSYPEQLFDDLLELANLSTGAKAVEVGAGPGVATVPLARRGLQILAIEPGPSLAALARRTLDEFPNVEVRTTRFEDAELSLDTYDLLFSASAWHWVDPTVGPELAANILKPAGKIALWNSIKPNSNQFALASKAIHDRWLPSNFDPHPMKGNVDNVITSSRFGKFERAKYPFEVEYDADSYLRLLDTHSSYRLLAPDTKAALFDDLATAINGEFQGIAVRQYEASLLVGTRIT